MRRSETSIKKVSKGVKKMRKKWIAMLTVSAFMTALLVVAVPELAAAQAVVVESYSVVQGAELTSGQIPPGEIEPPGGEEPPDCQPPGDEIPPQDEEPPDEDIPQDTPEEDTPKDRKELPYTAGDSAPYIFLGLAGVLLGVAGMFTCKVIAQKNSA